MKLYNNGGGAPRTSAKSKDYLRVVAEAGSLEI